MVCEEKINKAMQLLSEATEDDGKELKENDISNTYSLLKQAATEIKENESKVKELQESLDGFDELQKNFSYLKALVGEDKTKDYLDFVNNKLNDDTKLGELVNTWKSESSEEKDDEEPEEKTEKDESEEESDPKEKSEEDEEPEVDGKSEDSEDEESESESEEKDLKENSEDSSKEDKSEDKKSEEKSEEKSDSKKEVKKNEKTRESVVKDDEKPSKYTRKLGMIYEK